MFGRGKRTIRFPKLKMDVKDSSTLNWDNVHLRCETEDMTWAADYAIGPAISIDEMAYAADFVFAILNRVFCRGQRCVKGIIGIMPAPFMTLISRAFIKFKEGLLRISNATLRLRVFLLFVFAVAMAATTQLTFSLCLRIRRRVHLWRADQLLIIVPSIIAVIPIAVVVGIQLSNSIMCYVGNPKSIPLILTRCLVMTVMYLSIYYMFFAGWTIFLR